MSLEELEPGNVPKGRRKSLNKRMSSMKDLILNSAFMTVLMVTGQEAIGAAPGGLLRWGRMYIYLCACPCLSLPYFQCLVSHVN